MARWSLRKEVAYPTRSAKILLRHGLLLFVATWCLIGCAESREVYKDRGDGWFEKGKYEEAIADYSKAIAVDPKDLSDNNWTIYRLRRCLARMV